MQELVPLLLVGVALALGMLPNFLVVLWVWWQRRRDARRSPLTEELRNLPGEQAQREASRLMDLGGERLLLAVMVSPMMLALWALQRVDRQFFHFGIAEATLLAIVLVVSGWSACSAAKILRRRRKYLDGLAAERATAQALAPLTSRGCAIYHDIPAGKFNLDHVVVGPSAVFMIETKSRRKPATSGKASAAVRFNGEALEFPDWRDVHMLDQTRAQTRWLSDYLYRKTGKRVPVEPVLALPGWYVTCSVPAPNVRVINPKMCKFMGDANGKQIPEPQRRRIMTAIEERYSVPQTGLASLATG